MRIEHYLPALIAVLSLAAIFLPVNAYVSDNSTITSSTLKLTRRSIPDPIFDPLTKPWLHSKHELLQIVWTESGKIGTPVDCCPSVLEMVEPNGGTNINGTYVQLYQDGNTKQRFYELSCKKNIEGRPCRFMDRKLYNMSRCVQKYSYSYALVREQAGLYNGGSGSGSGEQTIGARHHHHHREYPFSFPNAATGPGGSGWSLDYIRVRSGCSCEIVPKTVRKRNNKHNKYKKSRLKNSQRDY